MHRFHFRGEVSRMRLLAFSWVLMTLSILALPILAYLTVLYGEPFLIYTFSLFPLLALLGIIILCNRSRGVCPICKASVFAGGRCSKHRKAHKAFGSYRLLIALSILFLGRLRCQYCGEHTKVESRHPR